MSEESVQTPDIVESNGRPTSLWADTWHRLRKHRMAFTGLAVFLAFFVVSLTGKVLTSVDVMDPSLVRLPEKLRPPLSMPRTEVLTREEGPLLGVYLLGTDDLGRDVFARMMQGAWVSLSVGFVAVGIAVGIGVILGGIAGYYGQSALRGGHFILAAFGVAVFVLAVQGKWALSLLSFAAFVGLGVLFARARRSQMGLFRALTIPLFSVDILIIGLIDIMLCFPSFFLILTVVALLPASIFNIMVVIGLTSWMGAARFVRAEFLALREQDFVAAARALGVPGVRIVFRHLLPNAMAPVLVSATLGIASAILTESALSFLGFGVPPPHATWGNILSDGSRFLFDAPWLTLIPGVAILIVVLAFNLFGEGLREILNPKLRERVP